MRQFLVSLLLLLAAFTASPALADPADIAATARSVVRVVLIGKDDDGEPSLIGHGSGIAVGPNLILTNAHVVRMARDDDALRIGVVPSQGKGGWFAHVQAYSPGNDLALLRLTESGSLPAATLFPGAVTDGEDVFAVGYPGGVDLAQGFSVEDMVTPASPVKTRGNVSTGRSSKQFDTILHTAAIGAGNSGGPLLDSCGRVIGVNSFGTISDGSDSEFFFAVSMREITRFLLMAKVKPLIAGTPCRSLAQLDQAEAARLAGERALSDEQARKDAAAMEKAERQAQMAVISERENGMAVAGVAALLAVIAGMTALMLSQRRRSKRRDIVLTGVAAGLLLIGAGTAWMMRPSLGEIDKRAEELVAKARPSDAAATASNAAGKLLCVLDPGRSRVTVSDTTDVPLDWQPDGCVNQRSQYGRSSNVWSRILVPESEDTVIVASFDPDKSEYRTDRYPLGIDEMEKLRAARAKIDAPSCGAGAAAASRFGADQDQLRGLLPATPNERLVYRCGAAAP